MSSSRGTKLYNQQVSISSLRDEEYFIDDVKFEESINEFENN
jgi:hypothetical protein